MIMILAGTKEGRELASLLISRGYNVLTVIASHSGSRIMVREHFPENGDSGPGSEREYSGPGTFGKILQTFPLRIMVDASHPFSEGISGQAENYSRLSNIHYFRFIRDETKLPESPLLFPVDSWEEAAWKATEIGDTIFLTTGSYNLELFLRYVRKSGKRLVVRVLPDHQVIEKVRALGVAARDIVAMQGPFSGEMNKATFKMYNASVIVTKDSGRAGGTDSKISAALKLKIPVVIIKRPKLKDSGENTVYTYEQVLKKIQLLHSFQTSG